MKNDEERRRMKKNEEERKNERRMKKPEPIEKDQMTYKIKSEKSRRNQRMKFKRIKYKFIRRLISRERQTKINIAEITSTQ